MKECSVLIFSIGFLPAFLIMLCIFRFRDIGLQQRIMPWEITSTFFVDICSNSVLTDQQSQVQATN